jgi:aryl-alcohol dehydrogenase-like predicted oxidoreductase
MLPRFSEENFPKNLVLVDKMSQLAKKKGVTPTQLTLAWLLAQGDDIIPIPGSLKIERVKENLGSLHIELSDEEVKEIREACKNAEVHGDRYPGNFVQYLFADTLEE